MKHAATAIATLMEEDSRRLADTMRRDIERQFWLGGSWSAAPRVTAAKDVNEPATMGGLGPKE